MQPYQPDHPAIADTVGFVYFQMGRNEAAVQQFRYAIELADSKGASIATVNYHLRLALQAMGRKTEAIAAFEKALVLDSDFAEAVDARRQIEAMKRVSTEAKRAS